MAKSACDVVVEMGSCAAAADDGVRVFVMVMSVICAVALIARRCNSIPRAAHEQVHGVEACGGSVNTSLQKNHAG